MERVWNGVERVNLRVGISGTSLEWSGTSQFAGRSQWDEFGYDWNEFSFRVRISGTTLDLTGFGTVQVLFLVPECRPFFGDIFWNCQLHVRYKMKEWYSYTFTKVRPLRFLRELRIWASSGLVLSFSMWTFFWEIFREVGIIYTF